MFTEMIVFLISHILCISQQWIATINNISKRIYLSENAEVCFLVSSLKNRQSVPVHWDILVIEIQREMEGTIIGK